MPTSQSVDGEALEFLDTNLAGRWLPVHADALVHDNLGGLCGGGCGSPATPDLLLLHPCAHAAASSGPSGLGCS